MSFVKYLAPTLLAVPLMYSPASALPGSASSKNLTSAVDPAVTQVSHKKGHGGNKAVNKKVVVHKKVVYRAGGAYSVAPVGWRRIGYRPLYWQTAGCVVVGGIWYCP